MRAVVVEDEILIREGICQLIEKMFPEIEIVGSAENGQIGLACILETNPDIVITDIRMPVMEGMQMIAEMQAKGYYPKVIVLTAYSEFSYAQKAVKLGVNDYLVKPIVVQEFSQTMRTVINLCRQDQKRMPESMGNLNHVLSGILHGTTVLDCGLENYLEQKFDIDKDMPILALIVYMGTAYEQEAEGRKKELCHLLDQRKDMEYGFVELAYDSSFLFLLYHYPGRQEVERWYQNEILLLSKGGSGKQVSCGMIEINGIAQIKEGYQTLQRYMDWNIVLGNDVLISYPKIQKIQTEVCIYPVELENQIKSAICLGDEKKIQIVIKKFYEYFSGGRVYAPGEIKESFVRFIWTVLSIAKEVGGIQCEEINYQHLIDRIMGAKTMAELENTGNDIIRRICVEQDQTGMLSLPVKKAQSMIHEFYADGITLAEIAEKLNMTQEYLGRQFHKELGENFSSYIRNYRIRKAKELLIGTQMKQYKIAEKVGYADAKYFAQVFYKSVGMSPAEYRKQNR